jgi:hypothetical protein
VGGEALLHLLADAGELAHAELEEAVGSSDFWIITRPSGFIRSEAVLAMKVFGPMPMEVRRHSPICEESPAFTRRAMSSARSGSRQRPVSSQSISSIESTLRTGTNVSTRATARWW